MEKASASANMEEEEEEEYWAALKEAETWHLTLR